MNDVTALFWIASYPKSGNTWLRCVIDSLSRGGQPPEMNELHHRYPWTASRLWLEAASEVPTSDMTPGELTALLMSMHQGLVRQSTKLAASGLRFIKVHARYSPEHFPANSGAVCIVRDPRDIAVSLADHAGLSLDKAIAWMGNADCAIGRTISTLWRGAEERIGTWSDHVESWLDGFPGPLLVMRYEDLLARPLEETGRLARFLGLPSDEQTLASTAANNKFEMLRAEEDRVDFIERGELQQRFFRRGRAGAWSGDLSPDQVAALIARHGAMMTRLGYATG